MTARFLVLAHMRLNAPSIGRQHLPIGVGSLFLAWLWLAGMPATQAGAVVVPEYAVKAAYLYNFAKFVEWPASRFARPDAPLIIGVVGEDPFGELLDRTVRNKSIDSHPLVVKRLQAGDNAAECHLLFIGSSEKERLAEILRGVAGRSVLLVSDLEEFLEAGGTISFFVESDQVKFAINAEAAQSAGLRLSSKLLAVAKVVKAKSKP